VLIAGCFACGYDGAAAEATCTKGQVALPHPPMPRRKACRTIP
jgi:hypothetical protein